MAPKYDIFKKTDNCAVWVEAVEDIVAAKKRLISLSTTSPGECKVWDSSRQEFINPMDECAQSDGRKRINKWGLGGLLSGRVA